MISNEITRKAKTCEENAKDKGGGQAGRFDNRRASCAGYENAGAGTGGEHDGTGSDRPIRTQHIEA
ncbi:hypothetical protein RsS62_26710 [Rhizobium dioscoreae]|nr:hypothetical protein RsS62_26710 [Rhizobium dioscoreae]